MMAANSLTGTAISVHPRFPQSNQSLVFDSVSGRSNVYFSWQAHSTRLRVICAAKPETVEKVCKIVKNQLALPDDSNVTGESKFAALGADSLDTVEIVMGLEEEFGISVEEDSAQNITTVQEAADLIEAIIEKQSP